MNIQLSTNSPIMIELLYFSQTNNDKFRKTKYSKTGKSFINKLHYICKCRTRQCRDLKQGAVNSTTTYKTHVPVLV